MKAYAYGAPQRGLQRALRRVVERFPRLRPIAQTLVFVVAFAVLPLARLLVLIGEAGHALGGWCGWETREW